MSIRELLYMAMTDATGGALGDNADGTDANNQSDAMSGGDHTTNDGDIPGVDDGVYDPEAERANAADNDVATLEGDEPGGALASAPQDPPYPGYVDDSVLATPGQIDPSEENDDRMGPASMRDLGIDPELREEMLDNAVAYGLDEQPTNVNDERAFDDGLPGSWSDFSPVAAEGSGLDNTSPEGAARFADPNNDAGGETQGPRVGGAGGFDGGPPRATPLPGDSDN